MLKYLNYDITFQEVPNEISLVINISGCPYKCKGCHSKILQEDIGKSLLSEIENILKNYKENITCICFMGGDQNPEELNALLAIAKSHSLKTCLYTGTDSIETLSEQISFSNLDYLKIGHYDETLGGLNSHLTNQKFYAIIHSDEDGLRSHNFIEITYKFQRREI